MADRNRHGKQYNSGLNERSKQVRRDTIKLSKAHGGYHYGGSFSAVEILVSLYDHILTEQDKFILSKGHSCWPYYVLLREKGFNPKLEGHPSLDEANGVYCTTGSLGHGLPMAIGMALARKISKKDGRIYVLMGDGECQEGTTWESLLLASKLKLDNLIAIVDFNGIQGSGYVDEILPLKNFDEIPKTLGWSVSIVDGHSYPELLKALIVKEIEKPRIIIAKTIKGKGVSFMENNPVWHAKWPDEEHEKVMMRELR